MDCGITQFAGPEFNEALDAVCTRLSVATGVTPNGQNSALWKGLQTLGVDVEEYPRNCRSKVGAEGRGRGGHAVAVVLGMWYTPCCADTCVVPSALPWPAMPCSALRCAADLLWLLHHGLQVGPQAEHRRDVAGRCGRVRRAGLCGLLGGARAHLGDHKPRGEGHKYGGGCGAKGISKGEGS